VSRPDASPRVTVIIATYNWAPVLPYSIGSVLDQTFTDFELLVVGDGCTDESGDVVAAVDDERVSWHNLAVNAGHQSAPNNEGIHQARGSVIAYLGHDDLWLPHHLETLVAAIESGATIAHATSLRPEVDGSLRVVPINDWSWTPGRWVAPTAMVHDRDLATDAGEWRMPHQTGKLDPEADLLERMANIGGSPRWVHRLTCVKFSAASRRDVYKTRPFHEQAEWLERIRGAEDPEADLLALVEAAKPKRARRPPSRARRLAGAVRRRLRGTPAPPKTSEERWRANRRFKGLEESG
jgi:glycosyltransferase involved in cell wall biosynthesis